MIADATGKWNKMSVDDLVKRCEDKWFKDKRFQNDYSTFVSAFYYNLVAQQAVKNQKNYLNMRNHMYSIDFRRS